MLLFILHELCTLLETWQCYSHESAKIKWNVMKMNHIMNLNNFNHIMNLNNLISSTVILDISMFGI